MVIPLDTYELDTWHLPTPDAKALMLHLLLAREAFFADNELPEGVTKTRAVREWFVTVPTRGAA
jgi:hypothetical protein